MKRFELDRLALGHYLGEQLNQDVSNLSATSLGASSRETPWRIDFESQAVKQSVLLRYGSGCSKNEVAALRAMECHELPTPKVLAWDKTGEAFGTPVFVSEFIRGKSLLSPMKTGEDWACELYIDVACRVQAIRADELPEGASATLETSESAADVLEDAYRMFSERDDLVESAYRALVETIPALPDQQFSNGDLWPDNLLIRDRELVGIIDWQHAGFSDPLFEFLLPFFLVPELRGRGIEERFCERKGINPKVLHWYHGLEFFDSLRWVLRTGKPYEMHTEDTLRVDLRRWLVST